MPLVLYEQDGPVATLTLNAPDELNAMSVAMGMEFSAHVKRVKKDKSVRVVILTGAGRAFSSGGHLKMLADKLTQTRAQNQNSLKKFYSLYLGIRDLPQPVIAAINGHAIGAGFCLALACDLRYAVKEAKMAANFAKIGLAPGMGGTWLISRLAGPTIASEILLTGKTFDAQQAFDWGLLNGITAPDELQATVMKTAGEIAQNGATAIKHIKKGIQLALEKPLSTLFDHDAKAQADCFKTADVKEKITMVLKLN